MTTRQYGSGRKKHTPRAWKASMQRSFCILVCALLHLLCVNNTAHAQCPCANDSLIVNTGYNPATGATVMPGSDGGPHVNDPRWMIDAISPQLLNRLTLWGRSVSPGNRADVIPPYTAWGAPAGGSNFINCFNGNYFWGGGTGAAEFYEAVFYRQFKMCQGDSIHINLITINDNFITAIEVVPVSGGTPIAITGPGDMPQAAPGIYYGTYSYYHTDMALAAGTYKLRIKLRQDFYYSNAIGLSVQGLLTTNQNSLVDPFVAPIIGPTHVCDGSTTATYTDATPGGTWSIVHGTGSATVSSAGVVTFSADGIDTLRYTVADSCDTAIATLVITYGAISITGDSIICMGGTVPMSAPGSGTWTSSDSYVASISGTGVVTGAHAGTANITFTTPANCRAIRVVTVTALPTVVETNYEVCTSITLHGSPASGVWSGSGGSASVTNLGAGAGLVTASASAGTAILTYTVGSCQTTVIVTVNCPCAALDSALTTLTSAVTYSEGCTYTCTASTATINGWVLAGYLWQIGSGAPIWDPSTSTTDEQTIVLPYSGTEVVTVTYYAVDSLGDTCKMERTITLNCEQQPCVNEAGTYLSVTSATDSAGNCVFTATANISTTHFILGYEWSTSGSPATVVHTTASTDSYTFTLPAGSTSTVSVIVHVIDPYFAAGSSPCCDVTLTQNVRCSGCDCFDDSTTTITAAQLTLQQCRGGDTTVPSLGATSIGQIGAATGITGAETGTGSNPLNPSCCYKVTVDAGLKAGCTIISYEWNIDGTVTVDMSSSTSDIRIIPVPSTGAVMVTVTIHAVDADGRHCDITRDIKLMCDCNCFNPLTTLLSYEVLSSKDCLIATGDNNTDGPDGPMGIGVSPIPLGCCYRLTATADLIGKCHIRSYTWDIDGAVTVIPSSSATNIQIAHVPDGGSIDVTVTITATDENGRECQITRTLTLKCGCKCFDDRATKLDFVKLSTDACKYPAGTISGPDDGSDGSDVIVDGPGSGSGCCYQVTALAGLINKCRITSYIWNVNGVISTVTTSAISSTRIIHVPASGIVDITVTITAVDDKGIPCSVERTLRLSCGCSCFNDATTTAMQSGSVSVPGGCSVTATAYASVNDPCKIIYYKWESAITSPAIVYSTLTSNSMSFAVGTGASLVATVTIAAVDANGDTCFIQKTVKLSCGRLSFGCCFDSTGSTLTYLQSSDRYRNCIFYITANAVLRDRRCRFIGYIWTTPTGSTGITSSSTYPLLLASASGATVTVTFLAINAYGDTCKMVKTLDLRCRPVFGRGAGQSNEDELKEQINVSPNPTNGAITVSSETISINTITVIDVNGQKVGNYTYDHAKSVTVSLDKLVPGTYLLRINNEISKTVIKDR